MKSIIPQEEGTCLLCVMLEDNYTEYGKGQRHNHHIFYGTGNHKMSEKYGMKVYLCCRHHEDSRDGVHHNRKNDEYLKRHAQTIFEEKYSHEKFMEVFGKNWL